MIPVRALELPVSSGAITAKMPGAITPKGDTCHGSHFWARELTALGHTVRLLPTQYVKPFLVGGKNDANDAAAICFAVSRHDIHPVPVKSAEQQSLQSVHRMRERLIHERTAKSNQIRSMFAEEGFVFPVGLPLLRQGIVALVNDTDARITPLLRRLGSMYLEQLAALQQWVDELAAEIAEILNATKIAGEDLRQFRASGQSWRPPRADAEATIKRWQDEVGWHHKTR